MITLPVLITTLVVTFLAGVAAGAWYNSKLLINLLKEQGLQLLILDNNNNK